MLLHLWIIPVELLSSTSVWQAGDLLGKKIMNLHYIFTLLYSRKKTILISEEQIGYSSYCTKLCRVGHSVLFRSFPFFSVRYITFFSVLKKECSVLFSSFWRLMRPKRTFCSFPFFSKERKRTQRTFRSF